PALPGAGGCRSEWCDLDPHHARAHHAEGLGGAVGEVDVAAVYVGTAVVDLDHHAAVVAEVAHQDAGAEREGAVGGGHGVHVARRPGGGLETVELGAVPGGLANDGTTGERDAGTVLGEVEAAE